MIAEKKGSIVDATEDVIAHQCNCITTDVKGVAEVIFKKYPWSNVYLGRPKNRDVPGTITVSQSPSSQVETKTAKQVINMFGQRYPGGPKDYETKDQRVAWFQACLDKMTIHFSQSPNNSSIAFPHGIGCKMAGGNWSIYLEMLKTFASKNPRIKVVIYNHEA